MLSAVRAAAVLRVADLAPSLKEAELRVLLHLAAAALASGSNSVRASSRSIADQTKCSRRNVQAALDSLARRSLIATRAGTATRPAAHLLNFLETVSLGGVGTAPPANGGGVAAAPPGWRYNSARGGVGTAPPPTEQKELFETAPGVLSISNREVSSTEVVIDRLLSAKPKDQTPEAIATARRWMHGYMAKLGREQNPHPPDDAIVAQFLAIAPWPALNNVLHDLLAERKEPGYSYAWFVSVALQRIHGIQPGALKQRRAAIRLVRDRDRAEVDELKQQIAVAAAGKRLR